MANCNNAREGDMSPEVRIRLARPEAGDQPESLPLSSAKSPLRNRGRARQPESSREIVYHPARQRLFCSVRGWASYHGTGAGSYHGTGAASSHHVAFSFSYRFNTKYHIDEVDQLFQETWPLLARKSGGVGKLIAIQGDWEIDAGGA